MTKKLLILLLCINIFVATAGAGLFTWAKPTQAKNFETFYSSTIQPLNTQSNINIMTAYMDAHNSRSIRVYVTDYKRDFYVVAGQGTYLTGTGANKIIRLTSGQIRTAADKLSDGKLSFFEKVELSFMLRSALN